jgi:hypothetical protein
VLVGTKSLLGEGWDAPSINCLILASAVGSYMLSNQMRGRAIRTDPRDPNKTANVWHLVTVEPNWDPGDDYEMMVRRFRSFTGVAYERRVIENGIERLAIGTPPFSRERVAEINQQMKEKAEKRSTLQAAWQESLVGGKRLVETLETPQDTSPRRWVFVNTLAALCWQGAMLGMYMFSEAMQAAGRARDSETYWVLLKVAVILGAVIALPFFLKAAWLFLMHGTLESSMREVGKAILDALVMSRAIDRSPELRVEAAKGEMGTIQCWLEGGTSFEKSLFLNSLREVLDPVENPRYVLIRKTRLLRMRREDAHPVPEILGKKKEHAENLEWAWKKHVGPAELIFTRTVEGRKLLLRARGRSLAAKFLPRSERRSCWK